ncbi:MAG: long-chain fatty acid--CoA ligase [Deltaproteobacteria bacterium]|nr:long-chain fatty acid--CoA ligase [Deltaproteobacteria bacterium]
MAYREDTLCGLFHNQALRYGDEHPFLMARFDDDGAPVNEFRSITWKQAREQVLDLARGMIALGVGRGDTVVVIAESRPRWIIADQAIQACGAIGVPLYPTCSLDELVYMIRDSHPKVIFASTSAKALEIIDIRKRCKDLKDIPLVVMSPWSDAAIKNVYTFSEIMKKGRDKVPVSAVEEMIQRVIPEDIVSIIYTSGTTGRPKGVVLTQRNFISNILQATRSELMVRQKEKDLHLVSLVHLPLCHSYGRTTDYHVAGLYFGGVLAFAEGYETIARDLLEIRPNIITSIPRFFEKTYDMIRSNISRQKPVYRYLFEWAMKKGETYAEAMAKGKRISIFQLNMFGIANMFVFDRLKTIMGMDRLVIAGSGGGKLSKEVCTFFRAMNIQLSEGYGLTETSPIINFNEPAIIDEDNHGIVYNKFFDFVMDMTADIMIEKQAQGISPYANPLSSMKLGFCYLTVLYKLRIKPGTVGRPVVWTEERIAPDGEILVKGPQIFREYWNLPDETSDAFTEDGWFKTGDVGMFDEDGFLLITDRKKDLFVTSGGKNIAPHPIEVAISARPYLDQVCLVGDGKKYITALIVPDFEELSRYAGKHGIIFQNHEELVKDSRIKELIQEQIDAVNRDLARYEQIKYFTILEKPFSIETEELTPTLKVKRRIVYEKHKAQIQAMYATN